MQMNCIRNNRQDKLDTSDYTHEAAVKAGSQYNSACIHTCTYYECVIQLSAFETHILFLLGNPGSAGSVPHWVCSNKNQDLPAPLQRQPVVTFRITSSV